MPAALRASTPDNIPGTKLVRLRSFNPRRGNVRQMLSMNWDGQFFKFEVGKGWYRVPDGLARYLATVPTREGALPGAAGEEDLPSAFHICKTLHEAEVLDRDERRRHIMRARPKDAIVVNDITTRSLAAARDTSPIPVMPPDGMSSRDVLDQMQEDEDAEIRDEEAALAEAEAAEEAIEAVEPVAPLAAPIAAVHAPARVHRETMAQVQSGDLTDKTAERAHRASASASAGGWGKAEALVGRTPIVEPGTNEQDAAADIASQRELRSTRK